MEDAALQPATPYGRSKLMTERMLEDVAASHPFNYCALRYFNVAGADPEGRAGPSSADATHLIKVAVGQEAGRSIPHALGPRRPGDLDRVVADNRRLKECLAWQPRYDDLHAIVADALRWEARLKRPQLYAGSCSKADQRLSSMP